MMMTMRMTTMATSMRETIADDDDKDKKVTTMAMISFFRKQPSLVGCIPGRGGVGDFYNDNDDEDDNDGNNAEGDHRR